MRTGIALGSNLGDRLANLRAAKHSLVALHVPRNPFLLSKVWETEPIGSVLDAPPYLNAVVEIECLLDAATLLESLQCIEQTMGRPQRRPRNAPRTVDLDILYIGETILKTEQITIPHPRMHQRRFVLTPLADIRPNLIPPGLDQTVSQLLTQAPPAQVTLHSADF